MKRVHIVTLAFIALAGVLVLPPGRQAVASSQTLLERKVTGLYRDTWVAAAWPVENVLRLLSGYSTPSLHAEPTVPQRCPRQHERLAGRTGGSRELRHAGCSCRRRHCTRPWCAGGLRSSSG